jgi:uncharacterized cupredoxin-like copper-binding protein
MQNFRTRGLLISTGVAGLLVLAACGGGGGGSGSSDSIPAGALVVEAHDIKFDKKDYTATAGEVPIAYVSKGQVVHDLIIFDADNKVIEPELRVSPGQTDVGTFDLPAGTYSMVCDIPGHREAGMTATLTVS